MTEPNDPYFTSLVHNATLKSFWRKQALKRFLRSCNIAEGYVASLGDGETKRDFLDRLFEVLVRSDDGRKTIRQMAQHLAKQSAFPDLEGHENSPQMKRDALAAVSELSSYLRTENEEHVSKEEQAKSRKRFAEIRAENLKIANDLVKMEDRLIELSKSIGTPRAGYDFQDWFYDLMDLSEIISRRPYIVDGRQIDGSVTVDGTTYLVELKFTSGQADAPDIDTFFKKVNSKADNTMGLMVSISGYSSVAISEASSDRTPLLLLDYNHVWAILKASYSFTDVVRRVRRHASQTGQAFLSVGEFGG